MDISSNISLMTERKDGRLSPTVVRVLEEYLAALHADDAINNDSVERLDALLRSGKVPRPEEIDAAFYPANGGKKP